MNIGISVICSQFMKDCGAPPMIGAVEFEHGLIDLLFLLKSNSNCFPFFVLRTFACRSKFRSQTSDNMDR